eukprot:gnl/Hemi2/16229_TR5396_c0_g1_i1.p1 gnl/Hemi2/16229_TR5396_c0_g1~~gnl/Hemi2/16229_TR5396_c0_g1_i1.p1  ORF type:complete len:581 (+),score=113.61 gnl/Hemi2/16229_TR5396_c0_g1_i1:70-1812(+)
MSDEASTHLINYLECFVHGNGNPGWAPQALAQIQSAPGIFIAEDMYRLNAFFDFCLYSSDQSLQMTAIASLGRLLSKNRAVCSTLVNRQRLDLVLNMSSTMTRDVPSRTLFARLLAYLASPVLLSNLDTALLQYGLTQVRGPRSEKLRKHGAHILAQVAAAPIATDLLPLDSPQNDIYPLLTVDHCAPYALKALESLSKSNGPLRSIVVNLVDVVDIMRLINSPTTLKHKGIPTNEIAAKCLATLSANHIVRNKVAGRWLHTLINLITVEEEPGRPRIVNEPQRHLVPHVLAVLKHVSSDEISRKELADAYLPMLAMLLSCTEQAWLKELIAALFNLMSHARNRQHPAWTEMLEPLASVAAVGTLHPMLRDGCQGRAIPAEQEFVTEASQDTSKLMARARDILFMCEAPEMTEERMFELLVRQPLAKFVQSVEFSEQFVAGNTLRRLVETQPEQHPVFVRGGILDLFSVLAQSQFPEVELEVMKAMRAMSLRDENHISIQEHAMFVHMQRIRARSQGDRTALGHELHGESKVALFNIDNSILDEEETEGRERYSRDRSQSITRQQKKEQINTSCLSCLVL